MGKIWVLVASDYQMVRSALRQLLKVDGVFDVLLTEADTGTSLARTCQLLSPDVLLLEIGTNSSSSLRVPVKVLTAVPNTRIVVLSANDNAAHVRAVFTTGVLGYILKAAAQSELFQAVKDVCRGRRFVDPRLSSAVRRRLLTPAIPAARPRSRKALSRRETEVLRAITLGFTTKEISRQLEVSVKTVQTYRERIYEKLAIHNRADLVHYALAHGLAGWEDTS